MKCEGGVNQTVIFLILPARILEAAAQEGEAHHARLAIIPDYSHYNFTTAPEPGPSIKKFLADPLTKPQGGGAAAASKATQ